MSLFARSRLAPNDEIRIVPPAIEGNIEIESDSAAVPPGETPGGCACVSLRVHTGFLIPTSLGIAYGHDSGKW